MRTALAALAVLLAAGPVCGAQPLLGPARDVALIDDFAGRPAEAWTPRRGSNVAFTVQPGAVLPGVSPTVLKLAPRIVDRADREPSHNWFGLTRSGIRAETIPADIDGFRVLLGTQAETQWWVSFSVTTADGTQYDGMVGDRILPGGRIVEALVPVGTLLGPGGAALTPEKARTIASVSLAFSVPGTALYLDRITAYRHDRRTGWLDFSTSKPATNMFERGQAVRLTFTPGGALPAGTAGFRWEARDFDGKVVLRGRCPVAAGAVTVPATPRVHGYYEVCAWFTDVSGRDLEPTSCIRAEGTVPDGVGTFAVLPVTVRENLARFRRLGRGAFFGLHGDFHGLADATGLAWRLDYAGWQWLEGARPDRSDGRPAAWARERLGRPPLPAHRLHLLPFRPNLLGEVPGWARSPRAGPPAFARWEDYLAMLRDFVRVERHEYPAMSPRLYGGAWELNLNMPPYVSQQPEHTPADVVELFRRTREAVKSEDPSGHVLGPCPSVLDLAWFEAVFRAGVLQYLDGIETHAYADRAWLPELNDYPGKVAGLKALVRRYKGRDLPIYCTEAGLQGMVGARVEHRAHAQLMVRLAIILKGEGARAFLAFYGIDYDRTNGFGFLFNREVDPPNGPWSTRRVSPKPTVNAMAACSLMLEGKAPRRRVRGLGADVWAYEFADASTTVVAMWTPGRPRPVRVPVAGVNVVRVVDLLGHARSVPAAGGAVRLTAGPSVQYIVTERGAKR